MSGDFGATTPHPKMPMRCVICECLSISVGLHQRQRVATIPGFRKTRCGTATAASHHPPARFSPCISVTIPEAPQRRHLMWMGGSQMRIVLSILLVMLPTLIGHAGEGMWLPDQLPKLGDQLEAAGLDTPPEDFADLTGQPMGAIVSLGGCSASFVSPRGLVVTNHHCAYGTIQYNSTEDKNLLTDGFLAATPADELAAAPGSRIYVTLAVADVTETIASAVPDGADGSARFAAIEEAEKKAHRSMRGDPRPPLQGRFVPRRRRVPPLRPARDSRRPSGLRSALFDRQVRRRYRQLDVAPPHRRFLVSEGVGGA